MCKREDALYKRESSIDEICILIGGRSKRLPNKLLRPLLNKTLIEHTIDRVKGLFKRIILVGNLKIDLPYERVEDKVEGIGPMGGLYSGLSVVEGKACFVLAADMPFVKPQVIEYIKAEFSCYNYFVVLPYVSRRFQPLCGVYSKSVLATIKRLIEDNRLKIVQLLKEVPYKICDEERLKILDESLISFFNINTEADMITAEKLIMPVLL